MSVAQLSRLFVLSLTWERGSMGSRDSEALRGIEEKVEEKTGSYNKQEKLEEATKQQNGEIRVDRKKRRQQRTVLIKSLFKYMLYILTMMQNLRHTSVQTI